MKRFKIGLISLAISFLLSSVVFATDGEDWLIIQNRLPGATPEKVAEVAREQVLKEKKTFAFGELEKKEDLKKAETIPFGAIQSDTAGQQTGVARNLPGVSYTVVKGDTVSKIYKRYDCKSPDGWMVISRDNNLDEKHTILVGQRLFIREEILPKELKNPLAKIDELITKNEEKDEEIAELEDLNAKRQKALNEGMEELTKGLNALDQEEEKNKGLLAANTALAEANVELSKEKEALTLEKETLISKIQNREIAFWLAVGAGVLVAGILVFFLVSELNKNNHLTKENNRLHSMMRACRLNVRFNSDELFGSYALYCTAYYNENGEVVSCNINPLIWGGDSILSPEAAREAFKSLLKKHLKGEEVPEVSAALKAGQIVQLDVPQEPEVIEAEAVESDDAQQARPVGAAAASNANA